MSSEAQHTVSGICDQKVPYAKVLSSNWKMNCQAGSVREKKFLRLCRTVCSLAESVTGWHYGGTACNLSAVKPAFQLPQTVGPLACRSKMVAGKTSCRSQRQPVKKCRWDLPHGERGPEAWQPQRGARVWCWLNANSVFHIVMLHKEIRALIRLLWNTFMTYFPPTLPILFPQVHQWPRHS